MKGKIKVYDSYESLLEGDDKITEFLYEKDEKKDVDIVTGMYYLVTGMYYII